VGSKRQNRNRVPSRGTVNVYWVCGKEGCDFVLRQIDVGAKTAAESSDYNRSRGKKLKKTFHALRGGPSLV